MDATDYLMFNVVFIGNNLSFVRSRFNMCNKFISMSFAINIEPVRPSTSTDFLILAHCVFELRILLNRLGMHFSIRILFIPVCI